MVLGLVAGSCASLRYYGQAVRGGAAVLVKRQPIERILQSGGDSLGAERRRVLEEALRIREFASRELGLPRNDSYRSVVDLGREEVTWLVTATPELSLEPVEWCFLFAGCVTYRGYFSHRAAERFAAALADDGYDVALGSATSYSTLGWFADPIFEPQLSWPRWQLAALVFHELAHQAFYLPGDTALNESFATAVEEWGLDRWLREDPESRGAARRAAQLEADFVARVLAARSELDAVYAASLPPERKRERKRRILERLSAAYLEDATSSSDDYPEGPVYRAWFDRPLNNAHIAAVADYSLWVPGLLARLELLGLDAVVAELEDLGSFTQEQRDARLTAWNEEAAPRDAESAPGSIDAPAGSVRLTSEAR